MTDSYVQVPTDSTGKKLDTEQLAVGANTVERERMQIAGASALEIARVLNSAPAGTEYALIVRNIPSGTQTVSGTVTANAGTGPFAVSDNSGSLTVDAPVGTPVAVRISDGTSFLTTTSGRLSVDGSGVTQPISGTVTANAGTGTFTVDLTDEVAREVGLVRGKTGAITLGDGESNNIGSWINDTGGRVVQEVFPMVYNGTTWDRIRGDITNGLDVDVTRVSGVVDVTPTSPVATDYLPVRVSDGTSFISSPTFSQNLADDVSNTMDAYRHYSFPFIFDGSTWDRTRGDSANGMDVDVTRLNDGGNSITVDQATPANLQVQARLADQTKTILRAIIDFTGTGDNTIVAADVSNKIKVLGFSLVAGTATNLRWKSGAATSLSGLMNFGANMGWVQPPPATPDLHWIETAVNQALILNQSGTAQVGGFITYYKEA